MKWKTSALCKEWDGSEQDGFGRWALASHNTFDGVNFASRKYLIDAQAAKANYYRGATASQFGCGKYSLKLNILPSDGNALRNDNAENGTRMIRARYKVRFFPHTYYREEALHELKRLESWDNTSGSTDIDDTQDMRIQGTDGKPLLLLSANLDDVTPEDHQAPIHKKGSQIIRFGFEKSHPAPFRQSGVTADLNADGDVSDNFENKKYNLIGDSSSSFGIFNRMEGSVNPSSGVTTKVQDTWAYPMNQSKVKGWQERIVECYWSERNGPMSQTITGIEAVGGLIGIEMEYADVGGTGITDLQNYELQAELTCHGWTDY